MYVFETGLRLKKTLLGKKTLAYFVPPSVTKKKSLITIRMSKDSSSPKTAQGKSQRRKQVLCQRTFEI
jgi:hypothetical protein